MDSYQKYGITIVSILAIVVITLIIGVIWYNAYTLNVYVTNGYTLEYFPGAGMQWVKQ